MWGGGGGSTASAYCPGVQITDLAGKENPGKSLELQGPQQGKVLQQSQMKRNCQLFTGSS